MKPGASERPSASIMLAAVLLCVGLLVSWRLSRLACSTSCGSLPVPSSTFALRMRVSQFMRTDSDYRLWIRQAMSGGTGEIATNGARSEWGVEQGNRVVGVG